VRCGPVFGISDANPILGNRSRLAGFGKDVPQGKKSLRENPKKKPQISPLRYAPVEMANLLQENALSTQWTKGRALLNKFVISTGA
jgi:hypothetical protein